jgi:type IV secretory pathway VirD2 relaxase
MSLLRGKQADGQDLVINPDYIRGGLRDRAQARVSIELGPRSEREISAALSREVEAIDDGLTFQLVPWRPALEKQLGRQVSEITSRSGGVDWNFGQKRGLSI